MTTLARRALLQLLGLARFMPALPAAAAPVALLSAPKTWNDFTITFTDPDGRRWVFSGMNYVVKFHGSR